MTENQKLRELLKEAREVVASVAESGNADDALRDRIDAALAEPWVTADPTLTVREACRRRMPIDGTDAQALEHAITITERERDEARAEIERLKEALENAEGDMHQRIRAGYDATIADCWRAKVAEVTKRRDEARTMVGFLNDAKESDLRMLRSTEAALDLTALENEALKKKAAEAFRRGAEAMREAAAQRLTCQFPAVMAAEGARCGLCTLCDSQWDNHLRALPIPEDK